MPFRRCARGGLDPGLGQSVELALNSNPWHGAWPPCQEPHSEVFEYIFSTA
jgi:hypothetical protein